MINDTKRLNTYRQKDDHSILQHGDQSDDFHKHNHGEVVGL